jgi:hypothetical protein
MTVWVDYASCSHGLATLATIAFKADATPKDKCKYTRQSPVLISKYFCRLVHLILTCTPLCSIQHHQRCPSVRSQTRLRPSRTSTSLRAGHPVVDDPDGGFVCRCSLAVTPVSFLQKALIRALCGVISLSNMSTRSDLVWVGRISNLHFSRMEPVPTC